ncbi:MAG: UDP-N-acetylglucosamine 2-epimerase (non-hydrolyzing) [Thermoplasmata archaeon]|nr:UDP-N-acetylglucosamine 2-epimerase (non-hydrolyzing) [Thermoplasmata archaeon]
MMKISIVLGTRPEIIKMAPIIHELKARGMDFEVVHTDQHYDKNMSNIFFEELELPMPDINLQIGSGTQAEQVAGTMLGLEKHFMKTRPDVVLVQGDTNAVLGGAIAAVKMGIKVGHVEAGLRSYDNRMPEEHNRRMTDHISAMLFAPTQRSADILENENVWGQIHVTGNTVIDSIVRYLPKAKTEIPSQLGIDKFILLTAHRAENVDNPQALSDLVSVMEKCPLPVVYPIHPRTRKNLDNFNLMSRVNASDNIHLVDPVGYFEFMALEKECSLVISDSGGIQEEVTAPGIKKPIVIIRDNTERPEAVESGFAKIAGTNPDNVLNFVNEVLASDKDLTGRTPFGDGTAGKQIVGILEGFK